MVGIRPLEAEQATIGRVEDVAINQRRFAALHECWRWKGALYWRGYLVSYYRVCKHTVLRTLK